MCFFRKEDNIYDSRNDHRTEVQENITELITYNNYDYFTRLSVSLVFNLTQKHMISSFNISH